MSNPRSIRFSQFFHRRNADATIDSICGVCFLTVASAMNEEEVRAQKPTIDARHEERCDIAAPRLRFIGSGGAPDREVVSQGAGPAIEWVTEIYLRRPRAHAEAHRSGLSSSQGRSGPPCRTVYARPGAIWRARSGVI